MNNMKNLFMILIFEYTDGIEKAMGCLLSALCIDYLNIKLFI